jgi:hypothetical protein
MLPSHKIKMAAYYGENEKCFRRHLGLSHRFEFLAWHFDSFCIVWGVKYRIII